MLLIPNAGNFVFGRLAALARGNAVDVSPYRFRKDGKPSALRVAFAERDRSNRNFRRPGRRIFPNRIGARFAHGIGRRQSRRPDIANRNRRSGGGVFAFEVTRRVGGSFSPIMYGRSFCAAEPTPKFLAGDCFEPPRFFERKWLRRTIWLLRKPNRTLRSGSGRSCLRSRKFP